VHNQKINATERITVDIMHYLHSASGLAFMTA